MATLATAKSMKRKKTVALFESSKLVNEHHIRSRSPRDCNEYERKRRVLYGIGRYEKCEMRIQWRCAYLMMRRMTVAIVEYPVIMC